MIKNAIVNKQEYWIEDEKAVNRKEVGRRIEELRWKKEISREQLAVKMGITTKYLYEIERAKKGFSADTLMKIAKVLSRRRKKASNFGRATKNLHKNMQTQHKIGSSCADETID